VAQQFLNGPEVGPSLEEMGRKGVAEGVGRDPLGQGQIPDATSNQFPDGPICQSPTAGAEEEGVRAARPRRAERQVLLESVSRGSSEGNDAFFSPFAQHPYRAPDEVHLGQVQPDELRTSNARGVEQLEDRTAADAGLAAAVDLHDSGHERLLESRRDSPLGPRGEESAGGVPLERSFPAQIPKERPEGGELSRSGDLAQAGPVKVREEGANQEVVYVPGRRRSAQLGGREGLELPDVRGVGPPRVNRGVSLHLEVPKERRQG